MVNCRQKKILQQAVIPISEIRKIMKIFSVFFCILILYMYVCLLTLKYIEFYHLYMKWFSLVFFLLVVMLYFITCEVIVIISHFWYHTFEMCHGENWQVNVKVNSFGLMLQLRNSFKEIFHSYPDRDLA